jgi:hypothetical protein
VNGRESNPHPLLLMPGSSRVRWNQSLSRPFFIRIFHEQWKRLEMTYVEGLGGEEAFGPVNQTSPLTPGPVESGYPLDPVLYCSGVLGNVPLGLSWRWAGRGGVDDSLKSRANT